MHSDPIDKNLNFNATTELQHWWHIYAGHGKFLWQVISFNFPANWIYWPMKQIMQYPGDKDVAVFALQILLESHMLYMN